MQKIKQSFVDHESGVKWKKFKIANSIRWEKFLKINMLMPNIVYKGLWRYQQSTKTSICRINCIADHKIQVARPGGSHLN